MLAGEEQPVAGSVVCRGALGYLRQDPRQHRADDEQIALNHILAARGLDEMADRMEKLRLTLEEHHTEQEHLAIHQARGTLPV